jgi:hypothetical protein
MRASIKKLRLEPQWDLQLMALSNYAELKQSVIDHLERSDLSDRADDFIDLAEARHKRDIRIREMLTRADLAIAETDQYLTLPADFLDLKYFRIQVPTTTAGRGFLPDLAQVNIHELTQYSVKHEECPYRFSVHENIELQAPADQAYTAEIFYYVELTPLDGTNTINSLLTKAPDVYLYGALAASAPFLMHDERVVLWETLYKNAADALKISEQDNRRGGPLVSRVSSWR